jgi:hypothetical protein
VGDPDVDGASGPDVLTISRSVRGGAWPASKMLLGLAFAAVVHRSTVVPAAVGDVPVVCASDTVFCVVRADAPAAPATSEGPASSPITPAGGGGCTSPAGVDMPCHSDAFGWFNSSDGCYYRPVDPPPPATDPVWEGRYPQGAIYQSTCVGQPGTGGGWAWLATPPDGGGGGAGVTPGELAQQAMRRLTLTGPAVRTAPPAGAMGLVNAPVWMWTDVTPTTWGPTTATASVPGLTVTATAQAVRIVWDMGDGHTVTCTGPGTPYRRELGSGRSPSCGYVYTRSSADQPGARYSVTATTTWRVTWAGGGQQGALTAVRASTTRLQIGELQVLS